MKKKSKYITLLLLVIIAAMQISFAQTTTHFKVLVIASLAKDHVKMIDSARPFFDKLAMENNFSIDFSTDTSLLNDENMKQYSVVVQLHLAPFDMSYSQQAALQKFIESGKGWVGIHAAGLTGKQFLSPETQYWQWFEDFMGGIVYAPHPAFQQGRLLIEDHKHPATKGLPASFIIADEWYEFNKSPRGNVHVLATADENSYHQNKPMGDHPVIWTNEKYPKTIYIGVGHDPSVLGNKDYVQLLLNSIIWAGTDHTNQ